MKIFIRTTSVSSQFSLKAEHHLDFEKAIKATVLLFQIYMPALRTRRMVPDSVNR
jgi:hypothetical protein